MAKHVVQLDPDEYQELIQQYALMRERMSNPFIEWNDDAEMWVMPTEMPDWVKNSDKETQDVFNEFLMMDNQLSECDLIDDVLDNISPPKSALVFDDIDTNSNINSNKKVIIN